MSETLHMPLNDVLLVGFDFTSGTALVIVGKKNGEFVEIINAFDGENAKAVYELLTLMPSEFAARAIGRTQREGEGA